MDRDNRWDRIEKAYQTVIFGDGPQIEDPLTLLKDQYKKGVGDEFILPHSIANYNGIKDGDGLFMINFRADRVRHQSKAVRYRRNVARKLAHDHRLRRLYLERDRNH